MIELDFVEKVTEGPEIWDIIEEGTVIGFMSVVFIPPNTLAIKHIEGRLGIRGVRGLQQAIKREYPTVTKVIGQRISGVRTRRASELLVVEQTI